MKPRKIAFYGLFGQQNLGNECTLQAILYHARRYLPGAEFMCICSDPNDTFLRHGIPSFPVTHRRRGFEAATRRPSPAVIRLIRKVLIGIPREVMDWNRAFQCLRGVDMFVVPGTGLLTDFGSSAFGYPYDLLKWSVAARLRGCAVLFVSVGAGPMYRRLTRCFIRWALSLADYRSYRDDYSRQFLEGIKFKTKMDYIYPDLAFSLPLGMFPHSNDGNGQGRVIGLGVKDYYGLLGLSDDEGKTKYRDFIKKLRDLVFWLLSSKYIVRLLIGDSLYDNQVKQDLLESLREEGFRNRDEQIINEPISTVGDLISRLASCDVVVSARFHNVLLGLMLGKPVISLSYHEKFACLLGGAALKKYCHDIDCLDVRTLAAQIRELEHMAANSTAHITQTLQEYRSALDEQYGRIFS